MEKFMKKSKKYAFTTLELMVVIAAIAVLASIILPAFGKVKRSMYMNQSKIQFNRYVFALNAYYREYGCFPKIVGQDTPLALETIISLDAEKSANLIRALSAKEIDGLSPLETSSEYLNPNGIPFLEFSDDDFQKNSDGTCNRARLADRFNNTDIKLVVESDAATDGDVLIPQSVFNAYPTIKEKVPDSGLREKVAIFTIGDGNKSLDVVSWKVE
ncbi:MAG: type II secretion system GspH family protein [Puniceicoccales bacterium]|jgi:type II secretory pathway pseudopilin PulG|nr:type II secretion system GspH family protein [Puniceicoccales bacterium]